MVPLDRLLNIADRAKEDVELRLFRGLLYDETPPIGQFSGSPDGRLLQAITANDEQGFRTEIAELERRTINDHSEWCHNEALIFLVLLGCEKFRVATNLPTKILNARDRNANSLAQKVNHVLRALSRAEHGMEGELCFIKLPYLFHLKKLRLTPDEARKAYDELLKPGVFAELSPFFQLLAARAYELVLFERKPTEIEQFTQIADAIERLTEKLTFKQVLSLLLSLKLKSSLVLWSSAFAVVSALFGIGYKVLELGVQNSKRLPKPAQISMARAVASAEHSESILRTLSDTLAQRLPPDPSKRRGLVIVETSAFTHDTGSFSLEAAISDRPVLKALGFSIRTSSVGSEVTIVPLRKEGAAVRLFISRADSGSNAGFILLLNLAPEESVESLRQRISLRVLD